MRPAKMKMTPHVLYSETKSICDCYTVSQKQGDINSLSYLYFLDPVLSFQCDGLLCSYKLDFPLLGLVVPTDPTKKCFGDIRKKYVKY